jgi:hypothetical protein
MLIDFDAIYNDYVVKWSRENSQKLKDNDPLNYVDEIYQSFLKQPLKQTGGLTAAQYFENLSGGQAVDMLIEYNRQNITVPTPLIDRLGRKSEEGNLLNLLSKKINEELIILAANLLEEAESTAHTGIMAEIMLDGSFNKDLRDFAAEILISHISEAAKLLIDKISYDAGENDMYIADVLVYHKGEDRVYKLLEKLFLSGKNNPLYAAYLGMYEDERALPLLQKKIAQQDLGYVEFLELRNSIERLGGEVDMERDFSFDPDYKVLKNIK